ncbi:hypothetical protein SUNI508_13378 [Seiridium unicorne]|uniref:Uncharacterized protein n=1 Tax=Seiridium unicorne TaxID=138068 RepID=A0ABR2VE99_9PEZI
MAEANDKEEFLAKVTQRILPLAQVAKWPLDAYKSTREKFRSSKGRHEKPDSASKKRMRGGMNSGMLVGKRRRRGDEYLQYHM